MWSKKFAKRGLRVGRLAAMMPTSISTLLGMFIRTRASGEVETEDLLLPDIVPGSVAAPIGFLEKVGLHGGFVDCDCGGEEAEAENYGEADAGVQVHLEFPDHGDGDQCEEEVGGYVNGGVEDADVLENDCIVASTVAV